MGYAAEYLTCGPFAAIPMGFSLLMFMRILYHVWKYNGVRPHGKEVVVHLRNAFRCRSANSLRPPTKTSCGDDLRSRGNATNTMGLDPVAHKSYVPHVITFAISRSSHICHLLAIPALNRQFAASHYLSSAQSPSFHQPRHTLQNRFCLTPPTH